MCDRIVGLWFAVVVQVRVFSDDRHEGKGKQFRWRVYYFDDVFRKGKETGPDDATR
jgi:hypothetical protein